MTERDMNSSGLSIVDLGNCENLLKQENGIDENTTLIIKKIEQLTILAERNVQYEVYDPITKNKLNLSICEQEKINIYIPIDLNEDLLKLYKDLKYSGYDLFNINDPFYNDFCTPYKYVNGTDVLLVDRKNDFYNNNYITCQSNCQYSSFNLEYKFLKCECKVVVDDIDVNDMHKFSQKIIKNFYDVLKYSNYKVMKCYKLVFNWNYLKKNFGNFIVFTFFAIYICFFIIYLIKGITPLKEESLKAINNNIKNKNLNNNKEFVIIKEIKYENSKNSINNKKNNFPPKKKKSVLIKNSEIIKEKKIQRKSHKNYDKNKSLIKIENSSNIMNKLIQIESNINIPEKSKFDKKATDKGNSDEKKQQINNNCIDDLTK